MPEKKSGRSSCPDYQPLQSSCARFCLPPAGTLLPGEDLLLVGKDSLLVMEDLVQLGLVGLKLSLVGEDLRLVGEDLLLIAKHLVCHDDDSFKNEVRNVAEEVAHLVPRPT